MFRNPILPQVAPPAAADRAYVRPRSTLNPTEAMQPDGPAERSLGSANLHGQAGSQEPALGLRCLKLFAATSVLAALPTLAQAMLLEVTVENLAPADSITFAPLRVGFHNGTYDAFDNGSAAGAAIISVAEGGSGSDWFPAFAAADPMATLGTVADGGPLLPGATASVIFDIDPSNNRFFTFAAMVVPSNDLFIGNDNPMEYELFDLNGKLNFFEITQTADEIWDAGSEAVDPSNAAFVVGGVNGNRTAQNGVVNFSFDELLAFDGLTTAADYIFDTQLNRTSEIYRISFSEVAAVPEPGSAGLMLLGSLALLVKRRRRAIQHWRSQHP